MASDFSSKELVAPAIPKVADELLKSALQALKHGKASKGIHAARRSIKRLRALLELARAHVPKRSGRKCKRALQRAAKRLAPIREAQVAVETFDWLVHGEAPDKKRDVIREFLVSKRKTAAKRVKATHARAKAARILKGERQRFANVAAVTAEVSLLRRAISRSYTESRRYRDVARSNPTTEVVHRWRKQVQQLSCYLELVRRVAPGEFSEFTAELTELSGLLGREHDLACLRELLRMRRWKASSPSKRLQREIRARRKLVRGCALELADRIFAPTPEAFTAGVIKSIMNYTRRVRASD